MVIQETNLAVWEDDDTLHVSFEKISNGQAPSMPVSTDAARQRRGHRRAKRLPRRIGQAFNGKHRRYVKTVARTTPSRFIGNECW